MAASLNGPHRLTFDDVNAVVKSGRPGVFMLGYNDDRGVFCVNYVSRSDNDVRKRLLDFIGSDKAFKFEIVASPHAAFVKECELFHRFNPRGNRIHPSRPRASDWICPQCRTPRSW